tara:strand:+ start:212 stop:535 length:324 start_codon:yes stop_codon:yes gene_type:complete
MICFSLNEVAILSNRGKGTPMKKDGNSKRMATQNSDNRSYHIGSSTYTVSKDVIIINAAYTVSFWGRFFLNALVVKLPIPLPNRNVKSNNENDCDGLDSFKLSTWNR